MTGNFDVLTENIRHCQICSANLSHQPKPIFQLNPKAGILIAGQAPGRKAHESGIPFNDPSGDRLRDWMGISKDIFYDATKIAIVPMSFCYPGHNRAGDLPPRRECAPAWRQQTLQMLPNIQLTLVIGRYAVKWHLDQPGEKSLTETVKSWQSYAPNIIPLPHPSPRNNIWLSKNRWFEKNLLPVLRNRINECLNKI